MSIDSRLDSIDKKFKPITEDISEERIEVLENLALSQKGLLNEIP